MQTSLLCCTAPISPRPLWMIMTDDIVTRTEGASSNSRLDSSALENLVGIIRTFKNAFSDLVRNHTDPKGTFACYQSAFCAFQHGLTEVLEEAVSAIEHLYIDHPNNVQLRELNTMMSRGRQFSQSGRFLGRNTHRRRNTIGTDLVRNPTSSRFCEDDEDSSDFETVSSSATYILNEDEGECDDEHSSSDCSASESDQYYYYSYLSMSDLASDGASIHSDVTDSSSDDDEDDFSDEEFLDDLDDWTKPVRLAKTCHVLTENVVREMLRNDYVPQWFDVVDLVLENDEQISKGPAEPDRVDDHRAVQDSAKDFGKLISKELIRNEQDQMISLVRTAPESTRLEITATTLFTPSNDSVSSEIMDTD